jgi:hypothetical protein
MAGDYISDFAWLYKLPGLHDLPKPAVELFEGGDFVQIAAVDKPHLAGVVQTRVAAKKHCPARAVHLFVVVVAFPKERAIAVLEAEKVVLAVWVVVRREVVELTHSFLPIGDSMKAIP